MILKKYGWDMRICLLLLIATISVFGKLPTDIESEIRQGTLQTFSSLETERILSELFHESFVERKGNDQNLRPSFVAIQEAVEDLLARHLVKKTIKECVGIIHTPTPATPFCTEGIISPKLTTKEVAIDPLRVRTIPGRAVSLRNFLHVGGQMFIVYPQEGLNKRTNAQQRIYKSTCNEYDSLVDCPIKNRVPDELIGATYVFTSSENQEYFFAIQATQANDARDGMTWKMWLGELSHPKCFSRHQCVQNFMQENLDTIHDCNLLSQK